MEFLIGTFLLVVLYKLLSGKNTSNQLKTPSGRNSSLQHSSVSSYRDNEDDLDEFATFTIHTSFGTEAEKSKNKKIGRWISKDEQLTINGRTLKSGFYYFGGVLNTLEGYHGIEPSLVDETRPVSKQIANLKASVIHTDESLGYWPSYASLSKECRGAYLDWLASDRSNSETPIGYIFIYFYGFERRIIENKDNSTISDQEFIDIFDEVLRLNRVFKSNRSFNKYSANFLELMLLLRPGLLESKARELPDTNNAISFKVKLAQTVVNKQPIDADLALAWLKNTFEYSLRMPARRCEDEFRALFKIRFEERFPDGLAVKPNKTKLSLSYHSASSGIPSVDLEIDDLPDPSILKGPINKLIPIAESCTDELNSYSRYLGKADTSRNDIAALMLLPQELANENNSPVIESFKVWAEEVIQDNEGLTTVEEFWSHTGMPFPKAVNKKETDLLTNLAAKANIGIAPDQRFHQAKIKADGNIVLFSPGHGEYFEPSKTYNQVGVAIRLGAMVAVIDGVVDSSEKEALKRLIEHDDKLSPSEKNSLKAYLTWRLNSPANTVGLKARIEQLQSHEIDFLKRFMISIALVDGKVDSSEIKQIEKLYTSLGLDKASVTSDIHHLTSSNKPATQPIELQDSESTFQLDEEVLALHESDTSNAKSMLESIFAEDEVEVTPVEESEPNGLDNEHRKLFDALLGKEQWVRDEVHELCEKLNLMVDGAIETINDWAYDKADAPVLDDDGDIYVDLEIVEELQG